MTAWNALRQRLQYHWRLHRVNHLPFAHKGVNVRLHNGSIFSPPEQIWWGNDIYVGPEAYFWADGGIRVHDNAIFGPRVSIFTATHKFEGADALPFGDIGERAAVEIFSNTWIGAYCLILPGVRIGEGAICGAGAVIPRHVPPLAVVAGNPAEIKRYRNPEEYLKLKREGRMFMRAKRDQPFTPTYEELPPSTKKLRESAHAARQREAWQLERFELSGRVPEAP